MEKSKLRKIIVTILIVGIFMVIMISVFDSMMSKKISAFHSEVEQIEEESQLEGHQDYALCNDEYLHFLQP